MESLIPFLFLRPPGNVSLCGQARTLLFEFAQRQPVAFVELNFNTLLCHDVRGVISVHVPSAKLQQEDRFTQDYCLDLFTFWGFVHYEPIRELMQRKITSVPEFNLMAPLLPPFGDFNKDFPGIRKTKQELWDLYEVWTNDKIK